MRPMLYNAFHRIEPVESRDGPDMLSRRRRAALREQRHARQGPAVSAAGRSATSSPCSTPAPTAPSWRRTTTAARCRRKCWCTTAGRLSSAGARRSTICSRSKSDHGARNHEPDRILIAFEGLDQSGKQTQAESLRDHLTAQGRVCQLLSFPDYATPIGSEIFKALHGERDYPPDVMQLLYVANRGEKRAQIESWIAAGVVVICDRYVASSIAYGEAHGIDAAWLGEIQRFLPAPAPDDPARHRARDRGRPQGGGARPLRARSRAAGARPRELPPPGRRGQLGAPRRRAREGETSRPTSFARSRHDSGCRHRADVRRARRAQHLRARLERRARRAHVVHQNDPQSLEPWPGARAPERKRVPHVRVPRVGREIGLRRRRAGSPQGVDHRHAQPRRELARLVEAARPPPAAMERHRHDEVRAVEHVGSRDAQARARGRARASGSRRT